MALELGYGRIVEPIVATGTKVFVFDPKQFGSFGRRFAVAGTKHHWCDAYLRARGPRRFRATMVEKYKVKT